MLSAFLHRNVIGKTLIYDFENEFAPSLLYFSTCESMRTAQKHGNCCCCKINTFLAKTLKSYGPAMNCPDFQRLNFASRKQRFFVMVGLVCWGLTLIAGIMCLANYSSSPRFPIKTNVPARSDSLVHPPASVSSRRDLGCVENPRSAEFGHLLAFAVPLYPCESITLFDRKLR